MEIIEGITDEIEIVGIVEARNKSTQVQEQGIQELLHKFDPIKEVLSGQSYASNIAYKEFIPLLPKILKLRDVINRDFKDAYKDVGRRFAWLEGTRDESVDTLEFLKEEIDYRLPVAYVYPLLAAFRSCVQCDKNKCTWTVDPIKFWDDIKESLVSRLAEQAMAHKNPDKFGKDPVVWGRCYDTALLEILKRKAGENK